VLRAAPNSTVVVLSGQEDEELALQAVQLGAQDFIVKGKMDGPGLRRALRYARERKRSEQRLAHLAHFDQLTGLANRVRFMERLEQTTVKSQRKGQPFGLMFLDLDGFKQINDTFGHDAGDMLPWRSSTRPRRWRPSPPTASN
jgi:PleD family two-component response regulator